jgi:DNA-directed RNA polymerase subunit L
MAKSGIDISIKSYLNDVSFTPNHLHLNFKGKDIDHVVLNTLRRTILEDIPSYGFNVNNINITKNSSVYNNDYMRNRIENFPLIGINFPLDLDEYNKLREYTRGNKPNMDEEEVVDEEEAEVTIYCNVKNEKELVLDVTSEDLEFYRKDKKIKSFYDKPVLLVKLKKNEEFEFSAKSDKGIAMNHSRYATVGVCCYEMLSNDNYLLKIEPRGQMEILDILDRACEIIKFRLKLILDKIMSVKFTNDNHGKIVLSNEDHTFGGIIARGLQNHKNIEFAGYRMDHLLIRDVTIEYITNGGKTINEIVKDVITDYLKLYDNVHSQFKKLKLK